MAAAGAWMSEAAEVDVTQRKSGRPVSLPPDNTFGLGALFGRVDALRQARLVTRGGVLVQNALLDRLVQGGDGATEGGIGLLAVAGGQSGAQLAQFGAEARLVQTIGGRALYRLPGALEGR